MTDELLPALPELPEPAFVFDDPAEYTKWSAQLRAYAIEAIRLAQESRVIHRWSGKCCSGKASPPAGEVA